MQVTDKVLAQGVALFLKETFGTAEFMDRLADRTADKLMLMLERVPQDAAAAFLGVCERTLRDNATEWGLTKSVALGARKPSYFLSELLALTRTRVIEGRKVSPAAAGKIVELRRAS